MLFSVALIHSSVKVVPLLTEVAHDVIADVELIHMVDEGLQGMISEAGGLTEPVIRRVCSCAMNAQEAGAEAIMLTAPSIGHAIDAVRAAVRVPVLRIDDAMAETAVQFATGVGVLAAAQTELEPTVALLRERAEANEKDIIFETSLCEEASRALRMDDLETYDRSVIAAAEGLAGNEVVVLADVMMHRVVHTLSERIQVPVLASPRHGFEDMAKKLDYFRR